MELTEEEQFQKEQHGVQWDSGFGVIAILSKIVQLLMKDTGYCNYLGLDVKIQFQ